MMALSHSSIELYKECPQRFKFRYVDGIKEGPKSYFSFGQSVHSALEFMYRSQLIAPSLTEIFRYFDSNWVAEGYASADEEQTKKSEGRRMIEAYYNKHIKDWQPAMATELSFNIELDGSPIRGKIDRVDRLASGALHVIDYKTGKSFSSQRTEEDKQLTLYQIACEQSLGATVEKLTLYHVPSLNAADSPRHSNAQVQTLRKEIIGVKTSIDRKIFDPKPVDFKCRRCDYKKICPAWSDTAPAPKAAKKQPPIEDSIFESLDTEITMAAPPWVPTASTKTDRSTTHLINQAIKKSEELTDILKKLKKQLPGADGF